MARVLLWSNAFWPLIGGVEVLGEKLACELRARGHEFAVITSRSSNLPEFEIHNGVAIHRLPMLEALASRNIDSWLDIRMRVGKIKREFKPQIVWAYLLQLDCMFHLMTEQAHAAPTLATVHGAFPDGVLHAGSSVGELIKRAAWLTSCSHHTMHSTLEQFPEVRSHSSVVWNGLDMPTAIPTPLPFDPPRLLCLGRIGNKEEKGFDLAIDTMPTVLDRFPKARLTIAGDGRGRAELEAHAAHAGVGHVVDFPGWVHPNRIADLINEATVVLMPSRVAEGFGLAALQAQQMARPVVASRVGGVPEVVLDNETGLLVDANSSVALADAILSLLSSPERAMLLGAAGRTRAEREFTFQTHADSYDTLLTSMARTPSVAGVVA